MCPFLQSDWFVQSDSRRPSPWVSLPADRERETCLVVIGRSTIVRLLHTYRLWWFGYHSGHFSRVGSFNSHGPGKKTLLWSSLDRWECGGMAYPAWWVGGRELNTLQNLCSLALCYIWFLGHIKVYFILIFLFLAVLGLHCFARTFSSCRQQWLLCCGA